jgi:hypothetical protein
MSGASRYVTAGANPGMFIHKFVEKIYNLLDLQSALVYNLLFLCIKILSVQMMLHSDIDTQKTGARYKPSQGREFYA